MNLASIRSDESYASTRTVRGLVLLATYNEASSIAPVLAEVDEAAQLLRRSGIELEILLVDDSSTDGTPEIARATTERLGLKLDILSGQKLGLGRAILRGFAHGLAAHDPDLFVTLDADGQHDARQIPDLVRAHLARGNGITIGSRWTKGGTSPGTSASRAVLSRFGNFLARRITGIRGVRDATTSFRVIDPAVARQFSPQSLRVEGYGFFSAFIALSQANGFSVREVPIHFRPRYAGVSKLTSADLWDFFVNLFRVRRQVHAIKRSIRADQTDWAQRSPAFAAQAPTPSGHFAGTSELELLARSETFNDWIAELVRPAVNGDVIEVGAGIGTISRRLAGLDDVRSYTAVEPDANLIERLGDALAPMRTARALHDTSEGALTRFGGARYDSLVYVNVLEHVKDHIGELRTAGSLARPGARLALFVPAGPELYAPIDARSGHYRRYTRASLRDVVESAGWRVDDLRFADVPGYFAYGLKYRLMSADRLSAGASKVYDGLVIPVAQQLHRVGRWPIGKNLVCLATWTGDGVRADAVAG